MSDAGEAQTGGEGDALDGAWSGLAGLLVVRDRLHAWAASRDGILGALAFGSTERAAVRMKRVVAVHSAARGLQAPANSSRM